VLKLEKSKRGLLTLSRDEMRDLGYAVVDMVVEHFEQLRDKQVTGRETRPKLEERLREPLPVQGTAYTEVLDQLKRDVFCNIMHLDHPRFFGFVPGPSNFAGAMADALASGFNVFAGTWLEASGPTEVESVTVDWLRQLCGLPEGTGGLFVSGGSMANLTALAVARHTKLGDDIGRHLLFRSDSFLH